MNHLKLPVSNFASFLTKPKKYGPKSAWLIVQNKCQTKKINKTVWLLFVSN